MTERGQGTDARWQRHCGGGATLRQGGAVVDRRWITALFPAVLLGLSLVAVPATASAAADDPAAVLQRMFDAQNRKDLNGMLGVMTDDVVQIGGACNFAPNPEHRCEGKQAFVKAFGPPDKAAVLRFVGTPRVAGDMSTG